MFGFVTREEAIELGCTNEARFYGLFFLPGYIGENELGETLWVAKHPIVDIVAGYVIAPLWVLACMARRREPDFMFAVGAAL